MKRFVSLFFMAPVAAFADVAVPAAAPAQAAPGGLGQFAPLLIIGVLFYFLLIRPQQRQAKEQQKMLDAVKKGDRILTQGGFYGTVVALKGKVIELKINDEGTKALIARSAVSQVVQGDPAVETPEVVSAK
jgi:preprotein translocase subunit YajC